MPPWTVTASAAVSSMGKAGRIKQIVALVSCFHLEKVSPSGWRKRRRTIT